MDVLDQLFMEAVPAVPPSSQPIQKLNYSHDAMIDQIIATPGISQNALAHMFGYSPSWICQVMASDAFQARLAARREKLVDPVLQSAVKTNFEALVLRSQEILLEKLNGPASTIPDQLAVQTLNIAAKAAGYGAREQAPPPSTGDIHLHLNQMGDHLVTLLRRKKTEVIDAEIEEIAGVTAEG